MAHIKISYRRECCSMNHTCMNCDSTSRCPNWKPGEGETTKCEHLYMEDVIAELFNTGFTYHSGDAEGKGGKFIARGICCYDLSTIIYLEINGKVIVDREEKDE